MTNYNVYRYLGAVCFLVLGAFNLNIAYNNAFIYNHWLYSISNIALVLASLMIAVGTLKLESKHVFIGAIIFAALYLFYFIYEGIICDIIPDVISLIDEISIGLKFGVRIDFLEAPVINLILGLFRLLFYLPSILFVISLLSDNKKIRIIPSAILALYMIYNIWQFCKFLVDVGDLASINLASDVLFFIRIAVMIIGYFTVTQVFCADDFNDYKRLLNRYIKPKTKKVDILSNTKQNKSHDKIERLTKIKSLLDKGLITEEEFENKKKQILGS